jgi:hypothetical protein
VQVLRVSRVRSNLYCRVSASATPGQSPAPLPWSCHTASADLKELPSADLHGSLLVSTLSRCFLLCGRRKGSKLGNPSVQEGYKQNTTLWYACSNTVKESEQNYPRTIENVTRSQVIARSPSGSAMICNILSQMS